MQKHRENTQKYTLRGALIFVLLALFLAWLLTQTAPVGAQGVFATPTQLPAIQATAQAAQQRADAARANLQQAAQLEAQAAEIRRNADVQAAQAAQAWSDARSASAAQNGAAFGEAIGRGEAALSQLQVSVNGQAAIIATLNARFEAQSTIDISMTLELQQVRAEHQTVVNAYTALVNSTTKAKAEQATDDTLNYIVKGFLFIVVVVLVVSLLWRVIVNRRERVTIIDPKVDVVDSVIDSDLE